MSGNELMYMRMCTLYVNIFHKDYAIHTNVAYVRLNVTSCMHVFSSSRLHGYIQVSKTYAHCHAAGEIHAVAFTFGHPQPLPCLQMPSLSPLVY